MLHSALAERLIFAGRVGVGFLQYKVSEAPNTIQSDELYRKSGTWLV